MGPASWRTPLHCLQPLRVLRPSGCSVRTAGLAQPQGPAALRVLAASGRPAHVLINLSLIPFTQHCWENEMRSWLQKHFGRLNASHRCRGGDVTGSLIRGGWRGRETEPKINFTHFPQPRPGPHQLLACKRQPHSGLCPLTSQAALFLIQLSDDLALWRP